MHLCNYFTAAITPRIDISTTLDSFIVQVILSVILPVNISLASFEKYIQSITRVINQAAPHRGI